MLDFKINELAIQSSNLKRKNKRVEGSIFLKKESEGNYEVNKALENI